MKNYVSKFKNYIGVRVDSYYDDDYSTEDLIGKGESRDENKEIGKILGRDILKRYVLKNANTFRSNTKKYIKDDDDDDDDDEEKDDEDDDEEDDDDDDDEEDDDDDDDDEEDDDDDDDDDDIDNSEDGDYEENVNRDSDNLDFLIIDDFPYQLSKYTASVKLKEVLIGNQCKYKN